MNHCPSAANRHRLPPFGNYCRQTALQKSILKRRFCRLYVPLFRQNTEYKSLSQNRLKVNDSVAPKWGVLQDFSLALTDDWGYFSEYFSTIPCLENHRQQLIK
jgi:hypothetical protein